MPTRDRERHRQKQREWRETTTPGYNAWLYARRKLRFENAEVFRLVLEEVMLLDDVASIRTLVGDALAAADEQEALVGNRYDHERDRPYNRMEGMMLGGADGN